MYRRGGHLGHVTSIMLIFLISMYPKAYIQNLVKGGPVVSEKAGFNFHMLIILGQGQYPSIPTYLH